MKYLDRMLRRYVTVTVHTGAQRLVFTDVLGKIRNTDTVLTCPEALPQSHVKPLRDFIDREKPNLKDGDQIVVTRRSAEIRRPR